MPTPWGENILMCNLSDEPELSEDFAAIFSLLTTLEQGGDRQGARHVVLDCAGVTYLNSSHIAQLLRMRKKLGEFDRSLVLCSLGQDVWSILVLSGLDKVFVHAPNAMTALAGLQLQDNPGEDE